MTKDKKSSGKNEIVSDQEITVIKKEANKILSVANSIEVTDKKSYDNAMEAGLSVASALKNLQQREAMIVEPLKLARKNAEAFFAPFIDQMEEAKKIIKDKMISWHREQKRIADEAAQSLIDRVERGTMKPETALRKTAQIETPEQTTKSDSGKAIVRTVRKVRITDRSLVPITYWKIDEVMVRKDALLNVNIPGVEVYEEEDISLNSN